MITAWITPLLISAQGEGEYLFYGVIVTNTITRRFELFRAFHFKNVQRRCILNFKYNYRRTN